MVRKALITGITGQDGSYLAELLLEKGYEVHGILRRSSSFNTERIDHIFDRLNLHYGDLTDGSNISRVLERTQPHEIYNLAAQSHVAVSFSMPVYTSQVDALGTVRLLDAVKEIVPDARFYQASTSELFGDSPPPQNEETPFRPRSPYAAAKLYAYWVVKNYREAYGLHASNGILFNHESPRRGGTFVTRKITRAAVRIKHKKQDHLFLGNLAAQRDWGYAPDYVEAMWLMLQRDVPGDYVVAAGRTHSVEEFCVLAFRFVDIHLTFEGEGSERVGRDQNGDILVSVDPKYFRPTEVEVLQGDPSKARKVLGWESRTSFKTIVYGMVAADREIVRREGGTW